MGNYELVVIGIGLSGFGTACEENSRSFGSLLGIDVN